MPASRETEDRWPGRGLRRERGSAEAFGGGSPESAVRGPRASRRIADPGEEASGESEILAETPFVLLVFV